jgi:hypothetical protein
LLQAAEQAGATLDLTSRPAPAPNGAERRRSESAAGARVRRQPARVTVAKPRPPVFAIPVTWAEVLGTEGDPDPGRAYWCRYENAFGQTWETRNPADRGGDLKIRRVRFPNLRERRDERALRRLRRRGEALERRGLREPREGLRPDDEGEAPQPGPEAPSPEQPQ